MKRLFQVLLVIGIIITAFSVYLLNINGIYAIFAAVFGVMIVSFSVFELISLKKMGKKNSARPINSKVTAKEDKDNIDWTYYDESPKTKPTPVQEDYAGNEKGAGKNEIKFTLFSKFLSALGIRKHPKVNGKKVEEETKEEIKKVSGEKIEEGNVIAAKNEEKPAEIKKADTEEEKINKLRAYVSGALKNNVSKEKIIESCNESGWPKEKVDIVLNEFFKPKKKNEFVGLYLLMITTIVLLLSLIFTENLLIGEWLIILRGFSMWLFYALVFIIVTFIGFIIVGLKEKLIKKKKVHEIKVSQGVSAIKGELAKKEANSTIDTSNKKYETDIDKLLALVIEKGKLGVDEVAGVFGISKSEAEEWGKILKDEGLITLYYPTVGEVELRWKKKVSEEEE
ncbi:MAG: hypothetical protein Q8Q42_03220 [Nanoarchaeota archaeon]|nr:hypothetical protein [Nanoarchaeota archaeon]